MAIRAHTQQVYELQQRGATPWLGTATKFIGATSLGVASLWFPVLAPASIVASGAMRSASAPDLIDEVKSSAAIRTEYANRPIAYMAAIWGRELQTKDGEDEMTTFLRRNNPSPDW